MKFFSNAMFTVASLAILFLAGCAASKVKVNPYVGQWEYVFPMEDGSTLDVTMTINETEQGYTGNLSSNMGAVDLNDLVIEDGKLTSSFEIQGYSVDFNGTFDGATYSGTTSIDGYDVPIEATKKASESN